MRAYLLPSPVSLQLHEFDEVRFDIRAHDCTYFFRARSPEDKHTWIEVIEANKVCVLFTLRVISVAVGC